MPVKKFLWPLLALAALFSGCALIMPSRVYRNAPLVLAYAGPEVIRDQKQVATLIVLNTYGLAVDGVKVKELEGPFNRELRVSQGGNTSAYIVDLLPGPHELTVTYESVQSMEGDPDLKPGAKVGSVSLGGYPSGPPSFSWLRTSQTKPTLKGGEIYVIGPKLMTVSGEIGLYPLGDDKRGTIIETRNQARF